MNSIHEKASALLPWYVNGTLAAHQREVLERHLGECLMCRAALHEEQRIHGLIQEQEDIPLNATHGIGNLLGQIDENTNSRKRLIPRPAFAAVAAVAAILLIVPVAMFMQNTPVDAEQGSFSTLTDSAATENQIDVVFAEGISGAEIDGFVSELNARLVAGPSGIGRYTLILPGTSAASVEDTIELLVEDPRIRFVGRTYASPATVDNP